MVRFYSLPWIDEKMEEVWPIPKKELITGWILARKNSVKLTKAAQSLYDSKQYSSSFVLSVLALEEYMKYILFRDAHVKDKPINNNVWDKTYKNHGKKLTLGTEILFEYGKQMRIPLDILEQEKSKMIEIVKNWNIKKFENIYLDWDSSNGIWRFLEDDDENLQKDSRTALELISKWHDDFLQYGEFVNEPIPKLMELLKQKKAYAMCENSGLVFLTVPELGSHKGVHTNLILSWHRY